MQKLNQLNQLRVLQDAVQMMELSLIARISHTLLY